MTFHNLYEFLSDLGQNNTKEWMNANRKRYEEVRDFYISWLNAMDAELSKVDPDYTHTTGKQAINRINNNLMYNPNKPIIKTILVQDLIKNPNNVIFTSIWEPVKVLLPVAFTSQNLPF